MEAFGNIAIIGNGNVGRYLHTSLTSLGAMTFLFARNPRNSEFPLDELLETPDNFEIIIVCVSDDAISEVCKKITSFKGLLLHVSGGQELGVIPKKHKRKGVLYPIMSFKGNQDIPVSEVPFCIEASEDEDLELLMNLVKSFGANWFPCSSGQRAQIHLAAVFVHNFSNHLFHISQLILEEKQLDFRILLPLLENAFAKLHDHRAFDLQTGPAVRNDQKTIKKHLAMIRNPRFAEIYNLLTKSIRETHDKKL